MIRRVMVVGAIACLLACAGTVPRRAARWSTIRVGAVQVRVPPEWIAFVHVFKQDTINPYAIGRGWIVWQVLLRPKNVVGGVVQLEGVRYHGVYTTPKDVLQRPLRPMRMNDERMGNEIFDVPTAEGNGTCTIDRDPAEMHTVRADCVAARPGARFATHAVFLGSEGVFLAFGGIEMTARLAAETRGLHPVWWKE